MERVEMLSLGGGVDSTCLLAMNICPELAAEYLGITVEQLRESIPEYEWVVFADPGSEWPETYENLNYAEMICEKAGVKFQRVHFAQGFYRHKETNERIYVADWRKLAPVEKEQYTRTQEKFTIFEWLLKAGNLPLMPGGNHVCSDRFKGTPQRKWAKEQFGEEATCVWSLGIEANESSRHDRFTMNRHKKTDQKEGHQYRYPLMELGMTRDDCIEMLKVLEWDYKGDGSMVAKSSCMWCPFLSDWEVDRLVQADGVGLHEALAIEKRFKEADKHISWHEAGMPLNKGGTCYHGHHRQPYVTGDCEHKACAADRKKNNKAGPGQLIQLRYGEAGMKRRLSIQEYVELGGTPKND
jgi:hypothetical protein